MIVDDFLAVVRAAPTGVLLDALRADGSILSVTYGEAAVDIARALDAFERLGLRAGDRIVAYTEDPRHLAPLLLAAAYARIVVAPLAQVFSPTYLHAELFQRIDASAVVSDSLGAAALRKAGAPCVIEIADLWGRQERAEPQPSAAVLEEALRRLDAARALVTPETPVCIQPTSGSTGHPKLVLRPHRALSVYADNLTQQLPAGVRPERFLLVAALTHAFGTHLFATGLRCAATFCVPSTLDDETLLPEINQLRPTVLGLTPRVQRTLHRQAERAAESVFSAATHTLFSAGGCPYAPFLRAAIAAGVVPVTFYGSSEAALVALTTRGEWRDGYAGRLIAGVNAVVAPDGELLLQSPGAMLGYYGRDDQTRSAYEDGFYRTGDIVELERDWLRIVGRKRDLMNTREGMYILPQRIEGTLESIPGVEHCVVLGEGLPYLTALVAVECTSSDLLPGTVLSVLDHGDVYRRVGEAIAAMNGQLERVERVARFALVAGRLPEAVYQSLSSGKSRRDRPCALAYYAATLAALYSSAAPVDGTFVPGADRRFRPRTRDARGSDLRALRRSESIAGTPPPPLSSARYVASHE